MTDLTAPAAERSDGGYRQFEEELAKVGSGAGGKVEGGDRYAHLTPEMRARQEAADRRSARLTAEIEGSFNEFVDFNRRIGRVSMTGWETILEGMAVSNVKAEVMKDAASQQLLTPEQLKEFGVSPDQGVAMVETALTDYTIEMLGLDKTGMNEAQKIAMARRIWGRRIVLANIMADNLNKGVSLDEGGLERHYIEEIYRELKIFSKGEEVPNLRSRVEFISAAMTTPEGAKKFIELAIKREREKLGAGEALASLS